MPSGTAMSVAKNVISIVPTIAGPIPPTSAGATLGGIELVRNCQLMIEMPLATVVTRTNPSGMITSTNAVTISQVMMLLLVRRQPFGSRRSTCCGSVAMAIRHPSCAGRSGHDPVGDDVDDDREDEQEHA